MRRSALTLTLPVSLALAACPFDAAVGIDASGTIECASADDCPSGWTCTASQRCFHPDALERASPSLREEPRVEPSLGSAGTLFTLVLEVDQALLGDPSAVLHAPDAERAFAVVERDPDKRRFVLAWQPSGVEPEGTHPVTATLSGLNGRRIELPAGALTLDFTAPSVVVAEQPTRALMAGAEGRAHLVFSEPVVDASLVMRRGEAELPWQSAPPERGDDETAARFTYLAGGSEAEGNYELVAAASDLAGNRAPPAPLGSVTLDFIAPELALVVVDPPVARPLDVLRVNLSLSEAAANLPSLIAVADGGADGFELDLAAGDGTVLSFSKQVPDVADGPYALELSELVDAAGNVLASAAISSFDVDGTPPALLGFSQSAAAAQRDGVVDIAFIVDEPIREAPRVTFGGVTFPPSAGSPEEDGTWRFALDMALTAVDGTRPIDVDVTDVAGNRALVAPGQVTVDSLPPRALGVAFAPDMARLGTTAYLTVTANEPLGAPPELSWSSSPGDPGFGFVDATGLGYTFLLVVGAGTPAGSYLLESLRLEDEAGNVAVVDLAAALGAAPLFVVDNLPPVITSLGASAPRYSARPGFDTVVVELDVDDDGGQTPPLPTVTLGARPMSCAGPETASPLFTCSYTVSGDEGAGAQPVLVTATDAAGNVGFASTSVELDFTPPSVVAGTETVQLVAAPDNPLQTPAAVTLGTRVLVGFSVDEPLLGGLDPVVESEAPALLVFARAGGSGAALLFEHELVDEQALEGTYDLWATLTDTVGNATRRLLTLPAPGLVVDRTPPPTPNVDGDERIRLWRAPWGAEETGGAVVIRVEGDAAATEGGTLLFYSAALQPRLELGRGQARADGSFGPLDLLPQDRAAVFVAEADAAGNVSSAKRVRDVEWVATLGGKVRGSTIDNPHRVELRPYHTAALPQVPAGEAGAADGIDRVGGDSVVVEGRGRWLALARESPPDVTDLPAAVDTARSRVVIHGGRTSQGITGTSSETWEWDGERWHLMAPTDPEGDGNPGSWTDHAMAYDPRRGRTVLFGGWKNNNVRGPQVWEWDGKSWELKLPSDPEGDGDPVPRDSHVLVFDPGSDRVLLDAGWAAGPLADTWAWDGESWELLVSHEEGLTQAPGARLSHKIVWDGAELVMFFGQSASSGVGTFRWDGSSWTRIERADTFLAWPDGAARDATGRIVLIAGFRGNFAYANGVIEPLPLMETFGGLQYLPFAYDPVRRQLVVLLDGVTYALEENTWTTLPVCCAGGQAVPAPRSSPSIATDPFAGTVMILDDYEDAAPWRFAGGSFTPLQGAGSGYWGSLLADRAGGRMLFSPDGSPELLAFTGTTFEPLAGISGGGHPWAWEPSRSQIVRFGSINADIDGAWAFTGTGWESITVDDPEGDGEPPAWRSGIALGVATDEARGRVVLYSGDEAATWEWTGASWERQTPQDPEGDGDPSWLDFFAMAYDPSSELVLLHGGWGVDGIAGDFWGWNGVSWRRLNAADPEGDDGPGQRAEHAMALDPSSGRILLLGGLDSSDLTDSVWLWDSAAAARPSISLHVDTTPAGLPGRGAEGIKEVRVIAYAGGRGLLAGAPLPGAELLGWRGGEWRALATVDADVGAPTRTEGSVTDPLALADMRTGEAGSLHFALAPLGANETSAAQIEVDYVEARVRYRLPPLP